MTTQIRETLLKEFDIQKIASGTISLETPKQLAKRLREFVLPKSKEEETPALEDLRLRLIANGLVAAKLRGVEPPWLPSLDELLLGEGRFTAQPLTTDSGISFLRVDSWMFVLFPPTNEQTDVNDLLNALNEVELNNRGVTSWVFDLSGITDVKTALVAFLIGFKQGLSSMKRDVNLLWLSPDAIPVALSSAVKKQFNLFKKGSFLLSKGSPA